MNIDNIRVRNWTFTLNNYTETELGEAQELSAKASYIIIGKEVGSNGTPHLQGYIEYPNAVRGSALKKLFNAHAHWEVRKGTAKQASEYCKKEGKFEEFGSLSQQGKRTDLEEVSQMVRDGETMQNIATAHTSTFIKYHKGILAAQNAINGLYDFKDRTTKPKVVWRWGDTGVGKSRVAREAHKSFYIKDGTPWWDGYTQQEAIIIDDFDGKWPFRDLLRLLDYGPYQGQIKGGYVKINSPIIYITCEFPPESAFHIPTGDMAQVLRRIDEVIHVTAELQGAS